MDAQKIVQESQEELQMFIFRESRKRPKEKGKDTHRLREGGMHSGNGKSGTSARYTNFNFVKDHDHKDGTVERADTYRAHSEPSNFGGDGREEVPGCAVYEKNVAFSPCVAQDDVSTFKATRLDAPAPPADRQDNDPDPEVSVQLEQAKEQAYLPFGEEKGKSKGNGKFPVRPSCSPLENRRQRTEELKVKTECDVYGRKGHWTYDRERAMSPSSLPPKAQTHAARARTRPHLSSQPEKVATCFVLNDCSDDSGILSDKTDKNVLLPKESTGQTFLTPTVSTTSTVVDTRTESVSDVCAVTTTTSYG